MSVEVEIDLDVCSPSSSSSSSPDDDEVSGQQEILVPSDLVGVLLNGSTAERIKLIAQTTKTIIKVWKDEASRRKEDPVKVLIIGKPKNRKAAAKEVDELIHGGDEGLEKFVENLAVGKDISVDNLSTGWEQAVLIPGILAKSLIGPNGQNIRELARFTRATLKVERHKDGRARVMVSGTSSAKLDAKTKINQFLERCERRTTLLASNLAAAVDEKQAPKKTNIIRLITPKRAKKTNVESAEKNDVESPEKNNAMSAEKNHIRWRPTRHNGAKMKVLSQRAPTASKSSAPKAPPAPPRYGPRSRGEDFLIKPDTDLASSSQPPPGLCKTAPPKAPQIKAPPPPSIKAPPPPPAVPPPPPPPPSTDESPRPKRRRSPSPAPIPEPEPCLVSAPIPALGKPESDTDPSDSEWEEIEGLEEIGEWAPEEESDLWTSPEELVARTRKARLEEDEYDPFNTLPSDEELIDMGLTPSPGSDDECDTADLPDVAGHVNTEDVNYVSTPCFPHESPLRNNKRPPAAQEIAAAIAASLQGGLSKRRRE